MQAMKCVRGVVCVVVAAVLMVGCVEEKDEKKSNRDRDDDVVQISPEGTSTSDGKPSRMTCGITDKECRDKQAMSEMMASEEKDQGPSMSEQPAETFSPEEPPGLADGVCGEALKFVREECDAAEFGTDDIFDGDYCVREDRAFAECILNYPEATKAEFRGEEDHPDYDDFGECIEQAYASFECERYDLMMLSCNGLEYEVLPEEFSRQGEECSEVRIDMGECAMLYKFDFCTFLDQDQDILEYEEGDNSFVDCLR